MRQSEAAVAVIRRQTDDGQTRWLARWNAKWQASHFVAGHRCPAESFRACLIRELSEELGLRESAEYSKANSPPLPLDFSAWSVSALVETRYVMELFDVELVPGAQSQVAGDPQNCWLNESEIENRRSHDGKAISVTMGRLLSEQCICRNRGVT